MNKTGIFVIAALCISLFFNGVSLYSQVQTAQPKADSTSNTGNPESLASRMKRFPNLSRRILTENPQDIVINFTRLRQEFRRYIEGKPNKVGMYFEYLPSGISVGINDRDNFLFASLLKIPVVMGIYKKFESGALKPDDPLTIKPEHIDSGFGTLWKKGPGITMSIHDLIEASLVQSDNTANQALLSRITAADLGDVFDALDIPKDIEADKLVISPKGYSSILRSLYLSSYLNETDSNEILQILTKTDFNTMLPKGVDASVRIAHKIGYNSEKQIFTDCGIIYVPNRPYILCVMVADTSYEAATAIVNDISKTVFQFVQSANPTR